MNTFSAILWQQITQDYYRTLSKETAPVDDTLTDLEKWEMRALDKEGGTDDLGKDLLSGMDVLYIEYKSYEASYYRTSHDHHEAKMKYGYLV